MNKIIQTILVATLAFAAALCQTEDASRDASRDVEPAMVETYRLSMRLRVPRIYDNMQSQGYRRYQTQWLQGWMNLVYHSPSSEIPMEVVVTGLTNRTHRILGECISYTCHPATLMDENATCIAVAVGSNRTLKFDQVAVDVSFMADPSYNIGDVEEDNVLFLRLCGMGRTSARGQLRTIQGSVVGRIGCGCAAYGHVSPTRTWISHLSDHVVDVAPTYGSFIARLCSVWPAED